jgi:hypothetical protein
MQRFRSSASFLQFTSSSEPTVNSDNESDNQPEQRLIPKAEVIRVGNLLDQVFVFYKNKKFLISSYLGTNYYYRSNSNGNSH